MSSKLTVRLLDCWAVVGVPIIYGAFVYGSYIAASAAGHFPPDLPYWPWYGVVALYLSGVIALLYAHPSWSMRRSSHGVVVATAYLIFLVPLLFLTHGFAACAGGDCL